MKVGSFWTGGDWVDGCGFILDWRLLGRWMRVQRGLVANGWAVVGSIRTGGEWVDGSGFYSDWW